MGFSSTHRIPKQVCFSKIFTEGIMINSISFRLFWNTNDVLFPRIAIRVPKKEISGAVERNRVKRLLREVFKDEVDAIPSFDYVIVCKRRLITCSNQEIRASLLILLSKIPTNLKKNNSNFVRKLNGTN